MKRKYYKKEYESDSKIKKIVGFISAVIFTSIFYLINNFNDNSLLDLIRDNNFIQSILIFLALTALIGFFIPMTIKKALSRKDVKEITSEEIEDYYEKEKLNKEIRKGASL